VEQSISQLLLSHILCQRNEQIPDGPRILPHCWFALTLKYGDNAQEQLSCHLSSSLLGRQKSEVELGKGHWAPAFRPACIERDSSPGRL